MRRAIIDIGTNTIKLLVADVDGDAVRPVHLVDRTTRLGEGIGPAGQLQPEPMARTAAAVADYAAEARHQGATDVRAVTTSAAREAPNAADFLAAVRRQCGLEVTVLSGERESELIYRGVTSDPAWTGQPLLVIDVGGGSAEFIQGRGRAIDRHRCLPIGAVRLLERFGDARFAELCEFLRTTLHRELQGYDPQDRRLIATGGTAVTLAAIDRLGGSLALPTAGQETPAGVVGRARLPPNRSSVAGSVVHPVVDHAEITLATVRALITHLHSLPLPERRRVPGLPPERADIIVAGGLVFLVAMELLHAPALTVSTRSLRFGALLDPEL